jgi:hypothetical protein
MADPASFATVRMALLSALIVFVVGCGSAATSAPGFPNQSAPCQGMKSAPSGTITNLTRLTAVYQTCDGDLALNYVKGQVSIVGYAGNGRDNIVGFDYVGGQVVSGWIVP